MYDSVHSSYGQMFAFVSDDPQTENSVGTLWGLEVLGVLPLFYDREKDQHYTVKTVSGMCGEERIATYFNIPKDGIVTVDGYRYQHKKSILH